jgi:hypothetical protein
MNLYNIDDDYKNLLEHICNYAEENGGEVEPHLVEELAKVKLERDVKIENTIKYYKNELSAAEAIECEIEALTKRAKSHHSHAEWVKKYLKEIVGEGNKIEYPSGKISWRKSTAVEVLNADLLPEEFRRFIPAEEKPDLIAIGKFFKENPEVDTILFNDDELGNVETAKKVTRQHISIK